MEFDLILRVGLDEEAQSPFMIVIQRQRETFIFCCWFSGEQGTDVDTSQVPWYLYVKFFISPHTADMKLLNYLGGGRVSIVFPHGAFTYFFFFFWFPFYIDVRVAEQVTFRQ